MSNPEKATSIKEARVKALDYIGGEGGYCEPLVVKTIEGEHYLLHQMFLSSAGRDDRQSVGVHRKLEYGSQSELEEAFREVKRHLTIPRMFDGWIETDRTLGFDIPAEEFGDAQTEVLRTPWNERLPL